VSVMRRSAGTRGVWGAIRAGFRAPSQEAIAADQEALRGGERLRVACSLRGSAPPYPNRLRQGELEVARDEVRWRSSRSLGGAPLVIEVPRSINVRAAGRGEWNVKKGGKAFGVIPLPEFKVVEATTDVGTVEFAVTSWDVPLVVSALSGDI
jgi:hypothetical protein